LHSIPLVYEIYNFLINLPINNKIIAIMYDKILSKLLKEPVVLDTAIVAKKIQYIPLPIIWIF